MNSTFISELQYFAVPDGKIAFDYFCASNQPKQLLILLNGFQRTRNDFRAFRQIFGQKLPHIATLAIDNRYSGDTKITEHQPLSIKLMSQDALAIAKYFCQKLQLNSFSILGISMGGMIAQQLAIIGQEIKNLFLVSTTAGGAGLSKGYALDRLSIFNAQSITLAQIQENTAHYVAKKFLQNSPILFDLICKSRLKNINVELQADFAAKQNAAIINYDGVDDLCKIKTKKTIIFSGTDDQIIPYANSYYLHKHIKNSQLITYDDIGHLILIENAQQFVEDVIIHF